MNPPEPVGKVSYPWPTLINIVLPFAIQWTILMFVCCPVCEYFGFSVPHHVTIVPCFTDFSLFVLLEETLSRDFSQCDEISYLVSHLSTSPHPNLKLWFTPSKDSGTGFFTSDIFIKQCLVVSIDMPGNSFNFGKFSMRYSIILLFHQCNDTCGTAIKNIGEACLSASNTTASSCLFLTCWESCMASRFRARLAFSSASGQPAPSTPIGPAGRSRRRHRRRLGLAANFFAGA